jgi:hypothetical protein
MPDRQILPKPEELADPKTAEKPGVLTDNEGSDTLLGSPGEVAEWLNAPVSKTG